MVNESARRRPPRLVPAPVEIPVEAVTFADQVLRMAAQDEQGDDTDFTAPDVNLQGEQPELYGEWPMGKENHFRDQRVDSLMTLHAAVWATTFCQLLAHNGADNPGMVEFARAGAQDLADHAAGVYRFFGDDVPQ